MARYIPPHPKKGSPEAKAWAERMRRARAAKSRIPVAEQHRRRIAAQTRQMPPAMRGVMGDYWNPRAPVGWEVEKGTRTKPRIVSRWIQDATGRAGKQVIQQEATGWRLLQWFRFGNQWSYASLGEYRTLSDALLHADYALGLVRNPRRPPKRWFSSCVKQVRRTRPRVRDPAAVCGALWHQKAGAAAKRAALARENPIAVLGISGNPRRPARVAGVLYNQTVQVRARKTTYRRGSYYHDFDPKSAVKVLALDNGDVLLHSTKGLPLWERA